MEKEKEKAGKPANLEEWWREPPAPLDFVLPNMVGGSVGALVSPGGAGKSMLALQLAIQISGGPDLLGIGELHQGAVTYLPAEDPISAVRHRWWSIGQQLDEDQRQRVLDGGLEIRPLAGTEPNIMDDRWHRWLHQIAEGRRLMILDTLRRFHQEEENASGPMAKIVGKLEAIATRTGCAIIFLHHSSKSMAITGAGDQQQASRGSSVLTDNIRWQAFMAGMSKQEAEERGVEQGQRGYFVRFGISKANYGVPFEEKWLRRHEGGVLRPAFFPPKVVRGGRDEAAY